jgi:hypothetical protein
MNLKMIVATAAVMIAGAELAWACNKTTYVGCSPEELRAIQQQQFYSRKRQPVSSDDYWRDRQYADRLRQEDRNHELEIEKIRSETAVEVARQERRSWRMGGYYFHRSPVIVQPRPTHPIEVQPKPYIQETVSSKPTYRRVPRASQ